MTAGGSHFERIAARTVKHFKVKYSTGKPRTKKSESADGIDRADAQGPVSPGTAGATGAKKSHKFQIPIPSASMDAPLSERTRHEIANSRYQPVPLPTPLPEILPTLKMDVPALVEDTWVSPGQRGRAALRIAKAHEYASTNIADSEPDLDASTPTGGEVDPNQQKQSKVKATVSKKKSMQNSDEFRTTSRASISTRKSISGKSPDRKGRVGSPAVSPRSPRAEVNMSTSSQRSIAPTTSRLTNASFGSPQSMKSMAPTASFSSPKSLPPTSSRQTLDPINPDILGKPATSQAVPPLPKSTPLPTLAIPIADTEDVETNVSSSRDKNQLKKKKKATDPWAYLTAKDREAIAAGTYAKNDLGIMYQEYMNLRRMFEMHDNQQHMQLSLGIVKDLSISGKRTDLQSFKRLDKDRSGFLDWAEILQGFYPELRVRDIKKLTKDWGGPHEDKKKLRRKPSEITVDWRTRFTASQLEEISAMFHLFNGDQRPTMSRESLRQAVPATSMTDKLFDEMFAQADVDCDGALSLEEFAQAVEDLYIESSNFGTSVTMYFENSSQPKPKEPVRIVSVA